MGSRLLIIYTLNYHNLLFDFFSALPAGGAALFFLTTDPEMKKKCLEQGWPVLRPPALRFNRFSRPALFLVLLPFLLPVCFLYLLRIKLSKKITAVVCFSWPEKIIITPFADWLGLKNIWIECPPPGYPAWPKWLKFLYRRQARRATTVALSGFIKSELAAAGLASPNIFTIMPGVKSNSFLRQENIFSNLAQAEQVRQNRKYFTIGTSATLIEGRQSIEILFRAVKHCLAVVPSLQLIVMGEGAEKKNLEWLAKKLEIGPLVWFVGEPPYLGKWLENLDVFAVTAKPLNLEDIRTTLYACAFGLPIIGPARAGLEDMVLPNQNGLLIEPGQSEAFARAIIELYQNRRLRTRYGQNGKTIVNRHFSLGQMVGQFQKILANA